MRAEAGSFKPFLDLHCDGQWVFAPRVVHGQHDMVGMFRRDVSHEGAVFDRPLSPEAENRVDGTPAVFTYGFQGFLEPVRGVGIIDEAGDAVFEAEALQPSRHGGHAFDPFPDGVGPHSEDYRQGRSREEVGHVVESHEGAMDPNGVFPVGEEEIDGCSPRPHGGYPGPHRSFPSDSVGDGFFREEFREPAAPGIIDVHCETRPRAGMIGEKPELRPEIALHVPVKIEVFRREVREGQGIEEAALEAVQVEAVGRGLHDAGPTPVCDHA